ncbi:glycosyltransferase [Pelagicoccus sp. SDUM812002]|uniref:glycosyltransferase family A protein n=1 Tax=Pelagicoccus sp. SDUM812002 TaxID=3041266 RepID=UPI00280FD396|nr:glycosyltransferase [Pelagicoccus sp. SDUM812002]MDQ8187868.1 glycosyltransferase [Pelagicoccus sp. SDUM812002]
MKEPQPKSVSFCIPCKNRLSYIKETLPVNLNHNRRDEVETEFVLVDFASEDGLSDWVIENCRVELDSGYLKLLYTRAMPGFHMSLAKNTAHAFASGKILTSLDADNFTGPRGGRYVYQTLKKWDFKAVLHQFSGEWRDGTSGRTSYCREHFVGVGGYNEQLEPFGHEELDLIARMRATYSTKVVNGLNTLLQRFYYRKIKKVKSHPRYNRAIKSPPTGGETYRDEMQKRNRLRSDQDIAASRFIANGGAFGIVEDIEQWTNGSFSPCETLLHERGLQPKSSQV